MIANKEYKYYYYIKDNTSFVGTLATNEELTDNDITECGIVYYKELTQDEYEEANDTLDYIYGNDFVFKGGKLW